MPKNPGRTKTHLALGSPDQMTPAIERLKRQAKKLGLTDWPHKGVVETLVRLALEPELMTEMGGMRDFFVNCFAKRPSFCLWFMHEIRQAALALPMAQHWVVSPHALERTKQGHPLTDDEIVKRIHTLTKQRIAKRSLETARRKIRVSQQKRAK
jgi:hypothetical protein